jgi:hypothetical protein
MILPLRKRGLQNSSLYALVAYHTAEVEAFIMELMPP